MAIEYTKKVIKHFQHPKNVGQIKNPSGKALEGNPACGDMANHFAQLGKNLIPTPITRVRMPSPQHAFIMIRYTNAIKAPPVN